MKTRDFQEFLFKSAVTVMASDDHISEAEIVEIKKMAVNEIYFLDYSIDNPLETILSNIKINGKNAINQYLNELAVADLSERQEILLIEVLLRMIDADGQIDEGEIKFLQIVKSKLKISEETLIVRFPNKIDYLVDTNNFGASQGFDREISIK